MTQELNDNTLTVVSKRTMLQRLKVIGPGAVIAASFIGPGTVTTATRAGASFGFALLWAVVFSIITTIILQEMAARIGIIAKKDLGQAISEQFKQPLLKFASIWIIAIAIAVGCSAYISGDLIGTSMGLSTLFGGIPANVISPFIGVLILILGLTGSYKIIERVMIFLVVIMSITFFTTMFVVQPDWSSIFKNSVVPNIPAGSIVTIIALIGTTVVPYNFFIHSSMVQENWSKPSDLKDARLDTVLSIGVGGLITAAILITAGATMLGSDVKNVADLSVQLEPLFGEWAKVFLCIGIFAAGFSSALASPLGAAVTLASVFGWKDGMKNKKFKLVFTIVMLIGIITSATGFEPMQVLLLAQALNGILLPIVAIYLLIVMNNKDLLGNYVNKTVSNIIGVAIVAVCVFLGGYSLVDVVTSFL
ncbi:Nramp family divalent metal transporter [Lysinibacillus sp. NPDC098008]|uniref:Nramp family divalent metal transporter n=1 Tax=Lysinibacillus sp. NPDC098008 TaxID=3364146 RepID=UPI003803F0D5